MPSTLITVLSLAATAVSTVSQIRASKRAQDAREEQAAISGANEEIKNRLARRRQAKRERIRRAQILASAEGSNVAGSSGALGAVSALSSSTASSLATQQSNILAAQGLTRASQQEADAISSSKRAAAWGSLLNEGIAFAKEENIFGD